MFNQPVWIFLSLLAKKKQQKIKKIMKIIRKQSIVSMVKYRTTI